jgi:hypothetical protein
MDAVNWNEMYLLSRPLVAATPKERVQGSRYLSDAPSRTASKDR